MLLGINIFNPIKNYSFLQEERVYAPSYQYSGDFCPVRQNCQTFGSKRQGSYHFPIDGRIDVGYVFQRSISAMQKNYRITRDLRIKWSAYISLPLFTFMAILKL